MGFEVNWIQQLMVGFQYQMFIVYIYVQDMEWDELLFEIVLLDFCYVFQGVYFGEKLYLEVFFWYVLE